MLSDPGLVSSALGGDRAAFALLYRRHLAAISTFIRRRVDEPEVAFDLVAETFASALAGLSSFDPARGSFRGWLFGIAANELRQAWRQGKVEAQARRSLGLEPIVLTDAAIERIESIVDDGAVVDALAQLPEGERLAIEARVLDGRAYPEIATELRCSELVVRKRVSRGLNRLRRAVGDPNA